MKKFVIERFGKNVLLKGVECSIPEIEENEILVKIKAASVNPIDYKVRNGNLNMMHKYNLPLTLGHDFSGVVVKTGKNVRKFKINDEVYGRPNDDQIGTFSEYISLDEEDAAVKPKNLTFTEAASIPLVGLTSMQALKDIMNIKKYDKILIHAGTGGVGTIAIQIAKYFGAAVATTVSDKGYDLVKKLGADLIINYKTEKFEEKVKDYNYVLDTLGGKALENSFKVIGSGGKIVSLSGIPDGKFAKQTNQKLLVRFLLTVAGMKYSILAKKYHVDYNFLLMRANGEQLEFLTKLIQEGSIKPIIDRTFNFTDTQKALDYVENGRSKGKVVIEIN